MRTSTKWTPLLFAAILALSGCSKTERAFVVDGAGFSPLTPSRETTAYIVNNDLSFARQVKAHNTFCAKQPGCRK